MPGIAVVLDRLAESGIVIAQPSGSLVLYQANRRHLAWPAVEALMGIHRALTTRLSDVDVLIVHLDDEPPDDADLASLRKRVRLWTGNNAPTDERIEVHPWRLPCG